MKQEFCPIPDDNPYKKIIEAEREEINRLDASKVKYYIDPSLIEKLGFEKTVWGFSWRNIINRYVCYNITAIHNPHENEYTYSISKLDNRKDTYDAPLYKGLITDFKDLVTKLDFLKVPRNEVELTVKARENNSLN